MIADRTARRSEHHPRLRPRWAYSSHDVLLKVAVSVISTSPPTPPARRAAHQRAILAHHGNKGNPTGRDALTEFLRVRDLLLPHHYEVCSREPGSRSGVIHGPKAGRR